MNFIDLEKLKITKEYNFVTIESDVQLDTADTVFVLKEKIRAALDYKFDRTAIETLYVINMTTAAPITDIDEADSFFTTVANVFSSVFLDMMCIQPHAGRKRERRLDVPEELKVASVNMSLLKKNVNMQTYCDRFNLVIEWQNGDMDYHYTMVPQRGDDEYDN